MDKFHRVFNGDDMVGPVSVDIVDHGRQSGGFTAACRSGYQHQPFVQGAEVGDDGRQVQLFERQDFCGNESGDDAHAVEVAEHVHAETVSGRQGIRQVGVVDFLELVDVSLWHDFECHGFNVFGPQRFRFRENHFAVDTVSGGHIAAQMGVGCTLFQHEFQKYIYIRHFIVSLFLALKYYPATIARDCSFFNSGIRIIFREIPPREIHEGHFSSPASESCRQDAASFCPVWNWRDVSPEPDILPWYTG